MHAQQISEWISDPRFQSFLDAQSGDSVAAVKLYMWHAEMGASCHKTLHHFEVLLRNAIDRQLGKGQPLAPLGSTWLRDPRVLSPEGLAKVSETMDRMVSEGQAVDRPGVVASLSLSFWKNLLIGYYEPLWVRSLRHAFPGAALRRDVLKPVNNIVLWRNRIAHHDSLLNVRLDYRFIEAVRVASFISPDAAEWLKTHSDMLQVLRSRP